jgi:hypothetical protein
MILENFMFEPYSDGKILCKLQTLCCVVALARSTSFYQGGFGKS